VLIVDDSSVIRQRLVGLLEEASGIDVVGEATDGTEGLELATALNPDVVVLDIRMPGMGGIELLERLRASNASTTAMVLTNFPYPIYRKRCAELGAHYFFDKSTEFNEAVEMLRGLSEVRR
jgi:DNA-binding NarL/FixJ family response regulator